VTFRAFRGFTSDCYYFQDLTNCTVLGTMVDRGRRENTRKCVLALAPFSFGALNSRTKTEGLTGHSQTFRVGRHTPLSIHTDIIP